MSDQSPHINKSEQEANANHTIAFGCGLLVIAIFGLLKQFDYLQTSTWTDGILVMIAVSASVSSMLYKNMMGAITSLLIVTGLIAVKHNLFEFKQIFFALLILVAFQMILKGIHAKDS